MENEILSLQGITKTYPGVKALDNVSLSFLRGEVHAVVGENGAGKSTLIKTVAGVLAPDSGEIILDGTAYSGIVPHINPHMAMEMGVSVIYQEFNLFESMSAAENIFLGERLGGKKTVNYKKMNEGAQKYFDRFGVSINPKTHVIHLSPAYKQIVEIAKAINKKAKVVIMDEPSAPLTQSETETLFKIVEDLKADGVTVIYISHRLDEIFAIADRVSVMRDGKYIETLNVKDTDRKSLIRLMVGREISSGMYIEPKHGPGETVLEVKNLNANGLYDISFHARRGEIVGFAGLVGAGRTELMRVIYGADKKDSGDVLVHGQKQEITSPTQALDLGIGLIPEDRKTQGVFLNMTIKWNTSISSIKKLSHGGVVDKRAETKQAQKYKEMLNIKTPSLEQRVMNLSGGNQQKVVLAKMMAANTDILIIDEPTRGIDVGAREEFYNLMRGMADENKAIIMVSSDMEELLGMSDRIIVMSEGKITGEVSRGEFTQEHILELASSN